MNWILYGIGCVVSCAGLIGIVIGTIGFASTIFFGSLTKGEGASWDDVSDCFAIFARGAIALLLGCSCLGALILTHTLPYPIF